GLERPWAGPVVSPGRATVEQGVDLVAAPYGQVDAVPPPARAVVHGQLRRVVLDLDPFWRPVLERALDRRAASCGGPPRPDYEGGRRISHGHASLVRCATEGRAC